MRRWFIASLAVASLATAFEGPGLADVDAFEGALLLDRGSKKNHIHTQLKFVRHWHHSVVFIC
jgi:hypothetical protein